MTAPCVKLTAVLLLVGGCAEEGSLLDAAPDQRPADAPGSAVDVVPVADLPRAVPDTQAPADLLQPDAEQKRRRVLIIGIDGAAGDELHLRIWAQGGAPHLKDIMTKGQHAPCPAATDPACARTHDGPKAGAGYKWLTAPGWASVLSGVQNSKHLVKDNAHASQVQYTTTSVQYPSFVKRAKDLGLKTGAAGVACFMSSGGNGIIDYECGHTADGPAVKVSDTSSCNLTERQAIDKSKGTVDDQLLAWLKARIAAEDLDIIFGVFDDVDAAGHEHGFSNNPGYMAAITKVDGQIGQLIDAVEQQVQAGGEEWLVIVTSDHGGHVVFLFFGGAHDVVPFEDEVVPFGIALYGSSQTLSSLKPPVTNMDVHPTVMHWLGQSSTGLDGKVQGLQ